MRQQGRSLPRGALYLSPLSSMAFAPACHLSPHPHFVSQPIIKKSSQHSGLVCLQTHQTRTKKNTPKPLVCACRSADCWTHTQHPALSFPPPFFSEKSNTFPAELVTKLRPGLVLGPVQAYLSLTPPSRRHLEV